MYEILVLGLVMIFIGLPMVMVGVMTAAIRGRTYVGMLRFACTFGGAILVIAGLLLL